MILNKKLILKIVAIVIVASIIISIFLWFYYKKIKFSDINKNKIISNNIIVNNNGKGFPDNDININSNINDQIHPNNGQIPSPEVELKSVVAFMAERIGSYSSDIQKFNNLKEINDLMTDKMKKEIDNLYEKQKDKQNKQYYGVTTKALSVKIVDKKTMEEGRVDVIINCQRIETSNKNNPISKIKYQNLRMRLIKNNKKWLVDSIKWE